jgi:ferrous iron transport protein B
VSEACLACPARRAAHLARLGVETAGVDHVVALAGNPNTGKSTVFNALTGLRQHTGNWPGKTVARAEGAYAYGGRRYKVIDLPGTYSLLATSIDEEIARDLLLFGRPDVAVVVVDSTCLERNLNLVLQVIQVTPRVVVCLNLMDEARRKGLAIDARRLAGDLGVPVVPTAARRREGLDLLLSTIADVASGAVAGRPRRLETLPADIERAIGTLAAKVEAAFPGLPNARWVAMRLLDGDERIAEAVRRGQIGETGDLEESPAPAAAAR